MGGDWREQRAERARAGHENPDLIPHGEGGYVHWMCRCGVCTEANRARNRTQRAKRSQRANQQPNQVPHGLNGYGNWGCRCPVCVAANTSKSAAYRQAQKLRERAQTPSPSDLDHP